MFHVVEKVFFYTTKIYQLNQLNINKKNSRTLTMNNRL